MEIENKQETEDFIGEDEEIDEEEEELKQEKKEEDTYQDKKIDELKQQLNQIGNQISENKFARVETKSEFASEIINIPNNQKIANLDSEQIHELQEKRKFVNLLNNFKWNRLADRILINIRDVENYSLSDEGMLIKNVMTEQAKTAQYTYDQNKKTKGGKK